MPVISGGVVSNPGRILFEEAKFSYTQGAAAGTYTATVTVPANSWLLDIKLFNETYWDAGTSALLDVGDAADPDGWFAAVNVKTTDLVAGANAEVIDFNNPGGKEGAYLVTATGERAEMYSSAARVVTAVLTTVGTASTAGETRMLVMYTDPTVAIEATYAAT